MNVARSLSSIPGNLRAWAAPNYSRFLIASDGAGWVLDQEAKEMMGIARQVGISGAIVPSPALTLRQCVHYTSHFSLTNPRVFKSRHRISVDYFHGKPEQGAEFAAIYAAIRANHRQFGKVRVSYSEMEKLVLNTGIDPSKVIRIPIGINPMFFRFQTHALKLEARRALGIPESAVVIGSFQKDGAGWGEGNEPKLVKGPDIFLESARILKAKIPELFVLLTGPARGFVKSGLARLGIPFRHYFLGAYSEIGAYYLALDAYIVSSREEGGPKAILESMISGVPIVSTRVGQAIDLIDDGKNGYLVDVGDAEALADRVLRYLGTATIQKASMLDEGLKTANRETYSSQIPEWENFFKGWVAR